MIRFCFFVFWMQKYNFYFVLPNKLIVFCKKSSNLSFPDGRPPHAGLPPGGSFHRPDVSIGDKKKEPYQDSKCSLT